MPARGCDHTSCVRPLVARWGNGKLVNLLDSNQPSATPQPEALRASERVQLSALNGMVSRIFLSWNQLERWLRRVEVLRLAS